MAIDTAALLNAVGEGIVAGGGPAPETTNDNSAEDSGNESQGTSTTEEGTGDTGNDVDGGGDASESDAGDEGAEGEESTDEGSDADSGEEDPKEGAEGKGRERDENGRFKPKTDAKKPDEAKPDASGKKPDPVNDPIPADLKKATRERMESLITTVKDRDVRINNLQDDNNFIVSKIMETKATPEQYDQALGYLRAVNTNDVETIKTHLIPLLKQELVALSARVGLPVEGIDILDGHADLKESVRKGEITTQYANQIALQRNNTQVQQTRQTRQNANQELQAEIDAGKAALNQVGAELATDPLFAQKKAILVESLKPVFAQIPPSQWAPTFKRAYEKLKIAPPAAPRTVTKPARQPTRTANPAGGQLKQPGNLSEAINAGIEAASRR